jgi:hypothetical protein
LGEPGHDAELAVYSLSSAPEKCQQNDDWQRNTQQPKQRASSEAHQNLHRILRLITEPMPASSRNEEAIVRLELWRVLIIPVATVRQRASHRINAPGVSASRLTDGWRSLRSRCTGFAAWNHNPKSTLISQF